MTGIPLVLSTLSLLGLFGCTSLPHAKPAELLAATPTQWETKEATGEVVDWLGSFQDPTLSSLVQEALEKNHDLRATAARVEAARAQAIIEGSARQPRIDAAPNVNRSRDSFRTRGEPQVNHETRFEALFNLNWELDVWGRLRALQSAAESDLTAAEADLSAARLSLAARVGQAYFEVLETALQVEVAETSVRERRTIAELVRGRYQRGLTRALDLRLTLTDVANAQAEFAQARNQQQFAIRRLGILLGRYPASTTTLTQALPPLPTALPAGVPAQLLTRRPDLRAAFARVQAHDWRVVSAQADFLPHLTLTGSGGFRSAELRNLIDPSSAVWNVAAGLLQPLFTGGRLTATVHLNQARVEEALQLYHDAALTAFREVEEALAAEEWLREQEQNLAEAVKQTTASRKLAVYSYRHSLIDILTLLDSFRGSLGAASAHLTTRRELLTNRINLYLALGGGI